MENKFMEAMQFRHACKLFDENKKISDENIHTIMESARLSPSSFGLELWKFLVITNDELRAKLRPFCWDQPQITTSSHLVVVLAAIDDAKVQSGTIEKRFARWGLEPEQLQFYLNLYANHLGDTLKTDENIYSWTARQSFIAAANMMTSAAYLGIDSCPIEGYDKEKVQELLGIDTSKYRLTMLLPFGYRVNPAKPKTRLAFDEVIEFIN
ncbi:NAD(P)H-dependent oxidoreductase [Sulfurimonas sp.]|uniref:NAD(P)H-dependent oxidoreductase n=1 Tax=Sulfurimonas sp. TaxID=2022749 RepID=UPI003D0BCD9D